MHRLVLLLILSSFVYTVRPSVAQDRRSTDRERILEEVRRTDHSGEASARQWAMEHRIPRRIVQSTGAIVELVAVYDGRPIYFVDANSRSAELTGTHHLHPGGSLGIDVAGDELEIGVWDSGHVRSDHAELSGRVVYGDEAEVSNHATHVAGTLAASGMRPEVKGMAFRSRLRSYSWSNDATEMTNEASRGLLLSNHSYVVLAGWHYGNVEGKGDGWYWMGDPEVSTVEDFMFGRYEVPAVQFDRVTYTNPHYLPVVAAGNDRLDSGPRTGTYRALGPGGGYQTFHVDQRPIPADGASSGFDTIAGAGVAKNVITVASVGHAPRAADVPTSRFSSFGPTDDGRVKPDLAGVGEGVFSLSADTPNGYASSSGTSMAVPNVAGSLLLLQEYHYALFGSFMRAATLKGLALHTATDLGPAGPDYRTGWGLLDTERAARQIESAVENGAALMEGMLDEGGQYVRDVSIESRGEVRVTLSWTDPPSTRSARRGSATLDDDVRHLRNDLDVRLVRRSTGDAHLPFVLDAAEPGRLAEPGDNVVDPVEQIYVANADTGRYAIVVTHKGTLGGEARQPFSLVVTGARAETGPVVIAHLRSEATLDGVTLSWRTLLEEIPGTFVVERAPTIAGRANADDFVPVGTVAMDGRSGRDYSFFDEFSIAGVYTYRISYRDGTRSFVAGSTNVNLAAPETYAVVSSYPNPFSSEASVVIDLPTTQHVRLEIFDVTGRRVASVLEGEMRAGRHHVRIRGDSWAPGVYFARVGTPNGDVVHRMIKR